jgi:hypothetical protein
MGQDQRPERMAEFVDFGDAIAPRAARAEVRSLGPQWATARVLSGPVRGGC